MANSVIQLKRTSVSGRAANSTTLPNPGELALNMADGILYSTNGSFVFEVGANNTNIRVTGNANIKAIIANSSLGTAGQVLTSNGTTIYWSTVSSGGSGTVTSVATGNGLTGGPITSTGTVSVLANSGIVANTTGLFVNASYIATLAANSANVANFVSTGSTTNTFTVGSGTYFVSNGNVGIGTNVPAYKLEVSGSFAATTKSFVIDHPLKTGMKLRYGSLEGPENGVYVRGRTTQNVIELPDYWSNLVDESSITVNLTSIGKHQTLYVKKIIDNKIHVGGSRSLDYFYVVFAERKDVSKLLVEY